MARLVILGDSALAARGPLHAPGQVNALRGDQIMHMKGSTGIIINFSSMCWAWNLPRHEKKAGMPCMFAQQAT